MRGVWLRRPSHSSWHIGLALMVVLLASPANAQGPDRVLPSQEDHDNAKKIIAEFGADDSLSSAQFRRYLEGAAFARIDANGDGRLDYREYAQLHDRRDVDEQVTQQDFSKWAAGGPLPSRLAQLSANWQTRLDQLFHAHCTRLAEGICDSGAKASADDVARYLAGERTARLRPRSAVARLTRLNVIRRSNGRTEGEVDREDFRALYCRETHDDWDADRDGVVEASEYLASGSDRRPDDFTVVAGKDGLLTESELCAAKASTALGKEIESGHVQGWGVTSGGDNAVAQLSAVTAGLVRIEGAERRAADEEQRAKALSRYVAGKGIRLLGRPKYDRQEKPSFDPDRVTLFLRIIKDFDKNGEDAAPAALSYSYDQEKHQGTAETDLALRLDWWFPPGRTFGLSLGYESDRAGTGDDLTDVRQYHFEAKWIASFPSRWIVAHVLRASPIYEDDHAKNTQAWAGVVEWIPELDFGQLRTGTWLGSGAAKVYVIPKLALELRRPVSAPVGVSKDDRTYWKGAIEAGVALGPRTKIQYSYEHRRRLGESERHNYQDATLSWELERKGNYSLTLNYALGEPAPTFSRTRQYKVALGIKY